MKKKKKNDQKNSNVKEHQQKRNYSDLLCNLFAQRNDKASVS